ncbi:uncharacterized protein LOC135089863 [Scylla paramamosain]|uniref:uncharacterized protein LOC135089863 n=1 Tax=Scylla paramamosain TaxID=85552 RepID=UPI003083C11B
MSGRDTPESDQHKHLNRELVSSEVDQTPASLPHPDATSGQAAKYSQGTMRETNVNTQNLVKSDEKCTESSKSQETEAEGVSGIQLERVRLLQGTLGDDGKAENAESDSSSITTSEDKVGDAVMHIFSIRLTKGDNQGEPRPGLDSESQPAALGTASTQLPLPIDVTPGKPRSKAKRQKGLGAAKDGKDSDSSVSSRKKTSKSKTKIKSKFAAGSLEYIDERLCGRIFSGWVEERQWVESLGGYRDIIEVDEWEVEMNHQLQAIISSIQGVQEGTKWINITPPSDAPYYRLWVLLEAPPTPGHYWYSITGVKLQPQFGLMISVKEIRTIHPHDGELAAARRARIKKASQGESRNELESMSDLLQDWMHQLSSLRPATVLSAITSILTLSNIKEAIRFLVVLVMTVVIGLVTFVREFHVVGLRFIREAGIFFHNATPFLQTCLGFFEKIVGGLYLLVAMVYRDFRRPSAPPPSFGPPPPALTPSPPPRPPSGPRAIQYVSPQRWVVKAQNNEFT